MVYIYHQGVREMSAVSDRSKFLAYLEDLIYHPADRCQAADAIRNAIQTLVDHNLCTLDEFLCLVDRDYKFDWPVIAGEIARKAEQEIRCGRLNPNMLKPWQNCPNYPVEFEKLAAQNEWRVLHSALDAIIKSISARFRNGF